MKSPKTKVSPEPVRNCQVPSAHKKVHFEAVAGISRGLAQACKGAGRPVDEVFGELEREDAGR